MSGLGFARRVSPWLADCNGSRNLNCTMAAFGGHFSCMYRTSLGSINITSVAPFTNEYLPMSLSPPLSSRSHSRVVCPSRPSSKSELIHNAAIRPQVWRLRQVPPRRIPDRECTLFQLPQRRAHLAPPRDSAHGPCGQAEPQRASRSPCLSRPILRAHSAPPVAVSIPTTSLHAWSVSTGDLTRGVLLHELPMALLGGGGEGRRC